MCLYSYAPGRGFGWGAVLGVVAFLPSLLLGQTNSFFLYFGVTLESSL